MFTCDKCGAKLEDGMKFCDKCGSDVSAPSVDDNAVIGLDDIKPLEETRNNEEGKQIQKKSKKKKISFDSIISLLPSSMTKQGDRTALMIGLGSLFALAVSYLVCFFVFMSDICMPVSIDVVSQYNGSLGSHTSGASALWIILYFILAFLPLFFALSAFLIKKFRFYSIFANVFILILTIFSFIAWINCEPSTIVESIDIYQSAGSIAWFAIVDFLSEIWYLKILLSLASIFGIGVDRIVNKGK